MKKVFLLLVLNSLFTCIHAQNFEWTKREGLWEYDYGYGIANDSAGNVYVSGKYEQKANFSGTIIPQQGNHDIYVAKYSPTGALVWIRTAGGWDGDYAHALACDGTKYVYVAGEIEGEGTIIKFIGSTITLKVRGINDAFLAKYDFNGNLIWARQAGGAGDDEALGVTYDKEENVYICGYFNDGATFGTTTINGRGGKDMYIAKFNKDGVFQWVRTGGSAGRDEAKSIKCDASGNIYVCGMYENGAVFGSQTLSSPLTYFNNFLAKYTPDGTLEWIKTSGGDYDDVAWSLTIDNSNKIYITGEFNAHALFSGLSLITTGSADIFIACYDASGNIQWVKKAGGSNIDRARGIGTDGTNLYITGQFGMSANFGPYSVAGVDNSEIFMAKLNNAGDFKWAIAVEGQVDSVETLGYESGIGICAEASGNVYAAGALLNGGIFGATSLNAYSRTDAFISKISQNETPPKSSHPANVTVMEGLPASFNVLATGSLPINYQWQKNGVNISGATTSSYTISTTQITDAGQYRVVVTNIFGNDTSNAATLTVIPFSNPSVCTASGSIVREFWANVTGTSISSIPVNTIPSSTDNLTVFEEPSNVADNYGSRIRGYVCPPYTGNYIFWIASDDNSELWLSTDNTPANKQKIASVSGYTSSKQWTKYPSQQSVPINLIAGQKYYIEALHKEGGQGDNCAVGWQLPTEVQERPIPGSRLSPYIVPLSATITTPINNSIFNIGSTITIQASTAGGTGTIQKVEFFADTTKIGEDETSPYSLSWNTVNQGNYELSVRAIDSGNDTAVSSKANITVELIVTCNATGTISRDVWNNISGTSVSAIPLNTTPSLTEQLSIFKAPSNVADNYGQRIRGFVCPPATGNYIFWIASDDNSELWLSTNDNPANKQKIASVSGYTSSSQWTKYPSQQSIPISLTAGVKYYIEALHKEGGQGDNCAVGWQLPNGTFERPIPGSRLSPFSIPLTVNINSPINNSTYNVGAAINIQALASGGTGTIQKVEFFADSTMIGADLTSPYSFIWNNASSGAYNLTAKVTDSLNNTAVSPIIAIHVIAANQLTTTITSPPVSSSFNVGDAITIEASASGGTGTIQKVEFFADSTMIGEDLTSPYSFIWNNASSGAYNLTAKVTDSLNNTAVSSIINITVNPANQLTTTITSPANTTTYPSPANITINATATSSGGSIVKVEFYQGSIKIGEALSAPYSFTWMDVSAGTYALKAIATDNNNQTGVSQTVNITVTTCPTPIITPSGTTTMCSGSVTLQSTIGSGYLYQWKKDGVNITGATNSFHIVTVTGSYQVKIIQGSCVSWSAPATVKIQSGLRASITPGGSTTICTGGNVKLFANTCSGYTYQWKKDGAYITGETDSIYIAAIAGNYQLQVTQAGLNAWSALVTVTVNACRESHGNSNEELNALAAISETTGPSPIFQMQVFPNPNTGLFTILLNMPLTKEEKVKMRIVNLLGQEVFNKEYVTKDNYIKEVVELDKSLPSGIYTLQVMIGNKVENTSVILSR